MPLFFMDFITIGIIGIAAYFLLSGAPTVSPRNLPGYNPAIVAELIAIKFIPLKAELQIVFTITNPFSGKFKGDRLAATMYYNGEPFEVMRDPQNFTINKGEGAKVGYKTNIMNPEFARYSEALTTVEFWQGVSIKGDFEGKDGRKIEFNNPVLLSPGIKITQRV